MREHLRAAFEEARRFLLSEGVSHLEVVQQNARGDLTRAFDLQAEGRIIAYFERAVAEPVRILTEERGEVRTRPGPAAWTLILDPVDGSANFARANEMVSISLALLPGEDVPRPDAVTHALVGNVFTGSLLEATLGEGLWRNGAPAQVSKITDLERALVNLQFNFRDRQALRRVHPLLERAKDIRQFGTAAWEFASVAYGGAEAYVDARDTLSPENYMAAYLLVRQAGGVISDRHGEPLAPVRSMIQGQSIVAACNAEIHSAVLAALHA